MSRPVAELIGWPAGEEPRGADVFVHNERVLRASGPRIWARLVDAEAWPEYYVNARRVRIEGAVRSLHLGAVFSWVTFGTAIASRVEVHEPTRELGWSWWCLGAHGYHAWRLEDQSGTTRVVTEETQRGPRVSRLRLVLRPALLAAHSLWLARLDQVSRT